jgi:hypothetical protein
MQNFHVGVHRCVHALHLFRRGLLSAWRIERIVDRHASRMQKGFDDG